MNHQLNGHEFEQTLGDGEGQESLMCCSPWGCKQLDTTEQLNNNKMCMEIRVLRHSFIMANKVESYYLPRISFMYSIELLVPLPVITKKKKKVVNYSCLIYLLVIPKCWLALKGSGYMTKASPPAIVWHFSESLVKNLQPTSKTEVRTLVKK